MYIAMHADHYAELLRQLLKTQQENAELKRQIEDGKMRALAKGVADCIDEWLDKPYDGMSERQDIEHFAEVITQHIIREKGRLQ